MIDKFKDLLKLIEATFPNCPVNLKIFPSGAAMLDITIGAETYVLEYHENLGIGINRMSTATYGWEGYEKPFGGFEEAKDYLLSLLQSTTNNMGQ